MRFREVLTKRHRTQVCALGYVERELTRETRKYSQRRLTVFNTTKG